ncbi:MAG: extracellular solute-binding protein, partial [Ruminococcus sp.]|nr:extracellular solute-binding protein [Ruminococcus sp.]
MKKLTAFICGLSIICAMTGCTEKKTEPEKAPVVPVVTQTIYKSEEFPMPDDFSYHLSLDYIAEKGTALVYQNNKMEYCVQYYDENMKETENLVLSNGDLTYNSQCYIAPDGTIHLVTVYGEYDGDISTDYEEYYANAVPKIEFYSYNPNGEKIGYLNVEAIPDSYNMMYSITEIIYHDGKYYLSSIDRNYVIDENGVMTELEENMNTVYAVDAQGRLVASRWEDYCYTDESLKYADNPTKFGEYIRRSGEIFTGAGDYSLFGVMQQGIYGMTADGQTVKLLDFVSSRVNLTEVYDVSCVGEGKFAAFTVTNEGVQSVVLLTVRPDDYVETREKVVLALDGINTTIDDLAATFNKSSDEYEVEVRTYEYGTDALRADVLSDNSPDIYCYSDLDTVQSYTNIGVFADMYELMDTYGGLSREDIMPNVLEAYETGDKLYFMSDRFCVQCSIAWSEVLGREYSNWTMDEFFEVVDNMPENMYIGDKWSFYSRYGLFCYLCQDNVEQWVDFDNNTCDFNSESF